MYLILVQKLKNLSNKLFVLYNIFEELELKKYLQMVSTSKLIFLYLFIRNQFYLSLSFNFKIIYIL